MIRPRDFMLSGLSVWFVILFLLRWNRFISASQPSSSSAASAVKIFPSHRGHIFSSRYHLPIKGPPPRIIGQRIHGLSVFRIRGGSTSTNDTAATEPSKRSKKKSSSSSKRQQRANAKDDIFQLIPISNDNKRTNTNNNNNIQVQAVLSARVVSYKTLARIVLGILAATFLRQCLQTVGIPRRQAIWTYLKDHNLLLEEDAVTAVVPSGFVPSHLESFLAVALAKAANDILPPSAMPQGRPLLGAIVASVAFVLGTILLPHWILAVQVWFVYHKQPQQQEASSSKSSNLLSSATAVLISNSDSINKNGNTQDHQALSKLYPTSLRAQMEHDMPPFYFEHSHKRYYFDPTTNQCWEGGPNLQLSISRLMQLVTTTKTEKSSKSKSNSNNNSEDSSNVKFVGILNKPSQLLHAQDRWYAYNHQTSVPIPTIVQALWERLKSPLVVVQLIGKSMAVLEEGKGAFFSLGQTIFQHYHNARKSILASRTLQQDVAGLAEEFATTPIWIYRNAHWKKLVASDLLPGDLFLLASPSPSSRESTSVIPVDALLVDGVCVTMEAVLTGESVPQTKMPLESTTREWLQVLDMTGTHRSAVLFAGTTLLHCAPPPVDRLPTKRRKKGPPPGVICLALRTGSYSSKGELISTLTTSRTQAGAATISNPQFDQDALRLITAMSVVSFLACASLFWQPTSGTIGAPTKRISGFRRTIQCTRIATACIPSDLPLALSAVVQSCANVLREEAEVVCSQPGALLTASRIDTCVFDKTGTITADTQSLSKVVTFSNTTKSKKNKRNVKGPSELKDKAAETNQQSAIANTVLAACHSLVYMQEDAAAKALSNETATSNSKCMVGDPLEQAALQFSGWAYHPEEGFYCPTGLHNTRDAGPASAERLWQIKVFPFSPTNRLSSVICLTRHSNGEFKLWSFVKGAPEAVQGLLKGAEVSKVSPNQASWFDRKVQKLESKGFRALALGAHELTIGNYPFLGGKSVSVDTKESDIVALAHQYTAAIHRSDVEGKKGSMTFSGLACFNAYTRPSSKRILRELKNANVNSIMLTGDGMRSALAVASKVEMLSGATEIAVLEMSEESEKVQWRVTSLTSSKKKDKVSDVSTKSNKEMLQGEKRGELALVASGDAITALLDNAHVDGNQKLLRSLNSFTVVARASPECKERFVKAIRKTGRRVLMTGDGVNDVSAMKEAELSVALLNGFGAEQGQPDGKEADVEDVRRRQRIKRKGLAKQIGPKDELAKMKKALEQEGIGSSPAAAASRVRQDIEKANEIITKRVAERHGISLPASGPLPYSMSDLKDMVSSIFSAVMTERRRAAKMKQGGGAAANILAEEDVFMKAGSRNGTLSTAEIRPGEACMASPFSNLRSSIDGVEAVLRAGVATAACALSVQQKIALHSLMSCFNLSALYRDGLKYGKNMWTAEFFLYMLVDQVSYTESTKMRPHLPRSTRPSPQSLFDISNILSVVLQACVHLITTEVGVRFGRTLTGKVSIPLAPKLVVRPNGSQTSKKMLVLLETLAKSKQVTTLVENEEEKPRGFFGRPKFIPNYETNIVFVLSVLQSTVVTLLLHKGKPFYPSILESRKLCMYSGLSVLFVVACILETFPLMSKWLELRPWESRRQKFAVLGLATANAVATTFIEWVCRQRFRSFLRTASGSGSGQQTNIDKAMKHGQTATAADEEEQVLDDEAKRNFKVMLAFTAAIAFFALDAAVTKI